jgi:hypothetical protein
MVVDTGNQSDKVKFGGCELATVHAETQTRNRFSACAREWGSGVLHSTSGLEKVADKLTGARELSRLPRLGQEIKKCSLDKCLTVS